MRGWRGHVVVIVMGVSGAGKTVVGEALAARLGWTFEDADDWHPAANVEKMRNGHPLTDLDRKPWLEALNRAMRGWVEGRQSVVLACSALKGWYRQVLREGIQGDSVRFAYLKGTYDEINQRLNRRHGHFMPESLLKSQFEALEEPPATEALTVDARLPVEAAVDAIVAGLHLGSPSPKAGAS
jgi:gluconokinase